MSWRRKEGGTYVASLCIYVYRPHSMHGIYDGVDLLPFADIMIRCCTIFMIMKFWKISVATSWCDHIGIEIYWSIYMQFRVYLIFLCLCSPVCVCLWTVVLFTTGGHWFTISMTTPWWTCASSALYWAEGKLRLSGSAWCFKFCQCCAQVHDTCKGLGLPYN